MLLNHQLNETVSQGKRTYANLKDFVSNNLKLQNISHEFEILLVSTQFVCKQLQSLKVNKAKGLDDIAPFFLKTAAEIVSPSLCYIFNRSIISGEFPNKWKVANVTPLYKKKGKQNGIEMYRPISILCTLSKILEKHVHQQMYEYLTSSNLLVSQQSGFRPKHSCATALTHMVDSWLGALNDGKMIGTVLID